MRLQYQNILASYSMVIETLTQRHLGLNKIVATCQHITWDKSSYIPYFNQTILDSYHARLELPVFTGWWPRIRNLLFISFYCRKFSFNSHFQVPMMPSRAIVKDLFPRKILNIISYFHVIHQYLTYWQRRWSVGYPNQNFILVYREIPSRKSQMRFLG